MLPFLTNYFSKSNWDDFGFILVHGQLVEFEVWASFVAFRILDQLSWVSLRRVLKWVYNNPLEV